MIILQPFLISSIGGIFGRDEIKGNLSDKEKNIIYESVYLYSQTLKKLIASTKTDEKGNFLFQNINTKSDTYFLVAHHPSGNFNGVIADNIGGENVVD